MLCIPIGIGIATEFTINFDIRSYIAIACYKVARSIASYIANQRARYNYVILPKLID